ncbi:MAG: aspartate/glutamate racemase family protein [Clostridiales bacterium]|nr:aspartate/glutamate racemase family protein [Clostridiales bacterium]
MKTIGIIGGMSYESTLHYYERINNQVNKLAGDLNCAELIIYNVNFQNIRKLMLEEQWDKISEEISRIAKVLENAGADYIAIATNTVHKIADYVQNQINVPLIHIADAVAEKCKESQVLNVGLLGTKYTMAEDFLKDRLKQNGLQVFVPSDEKQIDEINRIIFEELCKGEIKKESKQYFVDTINDMIEKDNISGVILGCTEIEMLVKQEDLTIPMFDTTQAHIDSIVNYSLEKTK